MRYTVFFEFYGRKMKTEVEAGNIEQAKHIVSNKIVFHKVCHSTAEVDFLKDFLGIK